MEIHLMSLNVAGLNNPIKRRRLKALIRDNRCDIFCCQETHLRRQEEHYIKEVCFSGTTIQAAAMVKTRGVLMGFSSKVKWQEQLQILKVNT